MTTLHYDECMVQEEAAKSSAPPGRGGPAFERSTGFLLSRVGTMARQQWGRMLAEHDLTPHHYGMLMVLSEQESVGPVELSNLVRVDPRNAVPIVDGLIERGLLVRHEHPTDRRRRVLALSPRGRSAAVELSRAGADIENRFLEPLSRHEQRTLNRLLATLADSAVKD